MGLTGPSRSVALLGLALILWGTFPESTHAQVLLTQDEALRLAFPEPAELERRTAFLSEDQVGEVARLAEPAKASARSVVTYYVGWSNGRPVGAAYFDVHRVRTLQEVLMVAVGPEGRVSRIEILGFAEPPEYMAPDGWLELFFDRGLEKGTSTRGDIPIVTGATLTSHSVSGAVRRSLALHEVLKPLDGSVAAAGPDR